MKDETKQRCNYNVIRLEFCSN